MDSEHTLEETDPNEIKEDAPIKYTLEDTAINVDIVKNNHEKTVQINCQLSKWNRAQQNKTVSFASSSNE
eukprot:4444633-Ditylum_brightwellii.AAC.1